MFIQFVSKVERLLTVFAVVGERPRKVDILNVVLRVSPLPIHRSTQGASVFCSPLIHNLLYVFKQHFTREPSWKEVMRLKRFSAVGEEVSVFFVNMLVELVFRGEDLVTLLAGIFKSLRKVDVLKVVQRVAFSVESLLAEGALEAVLLADHHVVFQHSPPCKRHKGHP